MSVRIAFLGDTLLGGEAQQTLEQLGYGYAFEGIAPLLSHSNLVVANLEGPVTHLDQPAGKLDTGRKRYWYRAIPDSLKAMSEAGVGVVSLANNHVLDFGVEGLANTFDALDAAGIAHCGAGLNAEQARRPAIVRVGGCRIGFLSVMQRYDMYVRERLYASPVRPGPMRMRSHRLREDVAELRQHVDLVVVLAHWGRNYRPVSGRQRRLAAVLVEAGADLVIGHHPHVPHDIEIVNGRPVFYSLGNGPLGTPGRFHSGRPPYGVIATVDIDASHRIERVGARLIAVDNSQVHFSPKPLGVEVSHGFLQSLVSNRKDWNADVDGALSIELV
jgi:poly-gamma-glutamate synthesis protein (capsule biosynthesis protein)